jgi:uncharacterized protein YkwD
MRKVIHITFALVLFGGGFWAYRFHPEWFSDARLKLPLIEQAAQSITADIKKQISLAPPLRGVLDGSRYNLTRSGVIGFTNAARKNNGDLPALKENPKLDQVAALRMQDMFKKQYFEHVSPSGEGAQEIADRIAYEYIALGENIALGNFAGDKALVQAWMDSPGHRANILNGKFTQIGVAVGQGNFDGRQVWIGVQVFSRPLSACPQPNVALKTQIESIKAKIAELGIQADTLKKQLQSAPRPRTQADADAYNAKVDSYNAIARSINAQNLELKAAIDEYNAQVERLNSCIAG